MREISASCPRAARFVAACLAALLMASCGSKLKLSITDPMAHLPGAIKAARPKVLAAEGAKAELTMTRSAPAQRFAQERPEWCWAACAQMVMAANGIERTQTEIANRVHGPHDVADSRAAEYREMLVALCPDLAEDVSSGLERASEAAALGELQLDPWQAMVSKFDHHAVNSDDLINALASGPAIVVLSEGEDLDWSHAYVAYGVGYMEPPPSKLEKLLKRKPDWLPGLRPPDIFGNNDFRRIAAAWSPKYAVCWVDLIDPDMNAVEEAPADAAEGYIDALPRLSGREFANRVCLILTEATARKILEEQYRIIRSPETRIGELLR